MQRLHVVGPSRQKATCPVGRADVLIPRLGVDDQVDASHGAERHVPRPIRIWVVDDSLQAEEVQEHVIVAGELGDVTLGPNLQESLGAQMLMPAASACSPIDDQAIVHRCELGLRQQLVADFADAHLGEREACRVRAQPCCALTNKRRSYESSLRAPFPHERQHGLDTVKDGFALSLFVLAKKPEPDQGGQVVRRVRVAHELDLLREEGRIELLQYQAIVEFHRQAQSTAMSILALF